MEQPQIERDTLEFLKELRQMLKVAIDAMGGMPLEPEPHYLAWGAVHVNRTAAGYCELRSCHQIYASKLLIRPAMEVAFAVAATFKNPVFLLEKARSESDEDLKLVSEQEALIRKMPSCSITDTERQERLVSCAEDKKEIGLALAEVEKRFATFRPGLTTKRERVSAWDAAQDGELGAWYRSYRTYCQFTHGTLRAISGAMDGSTDPSDNLAMIWIVLIILDHLRKRSPAGVPELAPFWARANAFLA